MRRIVLNIVVSMGMFLVVTAPTCKAETLGTFGATYPIVEKDAVADIEERMKAVDMAAVVRNLRQRAEAYRPAGLQKLPVAPEDRVFLHDMTYTTEMDIPDGKGGVMYPRGFRFNPLQYVVMPQTLIFIDGTDKKQLKWLEKSQYLNDINVMLILTDGEIGKMRERFRRPVYYAAGTIIDRMGIEHVPSVAVQKGAYMEISEYVPEVITDKQAKTPRKTEVVK